jgi:hypothetical protein
MKTKLFLLTLLLIPTYKVCAQNGSRLGTSAKTAPKTAWLYNPALKKYAKADASQLKKVTDLRRVVPGQKLVWALPEKETDVAHWEVIRVTDKEMFRQNEKTKYYPIGLKGYPSYREPENKPRAESFSYIGKADLRVDGLAGKEDKTNVFYFNKITLGAIAFKNGADYVLVTDTLTLSQPAPFNNTLLCVDGDKALFVKIIANVVIYEGPLGLAFAMALEKRPLIPAVPRVPQFVLAAKQVFFRTHYKDIKGFQLKQMAPIVMDLDETSKAKICYNSVSTDDQILLNRLHVNQLKQINDVALGTTNDPWLNDKIIERFQIIRFQKIKADALSNDPPTQAMFSAQWQKFDTKYSNYAFQRKRDFRSFIVISEGNVREMPISPIKYYTVPTQAKLVPVQRDTSRLLGHIRYNPTGEAKLKLMLDLELTHQPELFRAAEAELKKKGITLQNTIPARLLMIEEQALKIRGKTVGRVYPVSNNLIKLEINVAEESKTLIELFPKVGTTNFSLEYTFAADKSKFSHELPIVIDKSLLAKLDYSKPMASFDEYENSPLTKEVQLISNVFSTDKQEAGYGALDRVEVMVEIGFSGSTTLRGPYNLSAYNTLASKVNVPFLVKENNYTLTVSGRVFYEDGIRDIVPFTTQSDIINIDETVLK